MSLLTRLQVSVQLYGHIIYDLYTSWTNKKSRSLQVKISCCVDEVDILRTLAQVVSASFPELRKRTRSADRATLYKMTSLIKLVELVSRFKGLLAQTLQPVGYFLRTRTHNQRKRFTLNQPNTYSSESPRQK